MDKYDLIALDIDGTMVDDAKMVTPRTKAAISAAMEHGKIVTIITGRKRTAMENYVRELGLTAPFAVSNGARVETAEERLWGAEISSETTKKIIRRSLEESCFPVMFLDDLYVGVINDPENEMVKGHRESTRVCWEDYEDRDMTSPKIAVNGDEQALERILKYINQELSEEAFATRYDERNIEITNACTDKGKALLRICDMVGVPPARSIAVGDKMSDWQMLNEAGKGVAMGNGEQELKDRADYVCESNEEDGVAQVIERFMLA